MKRRPWLPAVAHSSSWRTAALLVTTAVVVALAMAGALWLRAAPARKNPAQFTFAAPDSTRLQIAVPVPSPDGQRIAFVVRNLVGQDAVWIRPVGSRRRSRSPAPKGSAVLSSGRRMDAGSGSSRRAS